MTGDPALKSTPLHEEHVALGAKLVPFAGFEMPVQYPTGVTAEHRAVRTAAGLFDVSHMGEIEVRGGGARDFLQYALTNDVDRLSAWQAQYSTLLSDAGTLLDDLLVYRFPDHYLLVVNASNRARDLEQLMREAADFDVELRDTSDEVALLALQGPRAAGILAPFTGVDLDDIGYYHFRVGEVSGIPAVVSRTGYTGEDGFELYVASDAAVALWRRLLDAGREAGLIPAGLGARDLLRLEMGYSLYGNDLDESRTPLEAGLGWVVKLDKGDFVGRSAVLDRKRTGITERLVGFRLLERGFPRQGYAVRCAGHEDGIVTSGGVSPISGEGLGLAYLPAACAQPGARVDVVIRGRPVPAEIVRPPFYTHGSLRA